MAVPKNVQATTQAVLISHASKVMLKILQAGRLQWYVNRELPDVQAGKKQKNQRSNFQHSLDHGESKGIPKKTSTSVS